MAGWIKALASSVLLPFLGFSLLILLLLMSVGGIEQEEEEAGGYVLEVSEEVMAYKHLVTRYCNEYGIGGYVDYILAIMQVESRGMGQDVMQSSESLGLPPGSLDPESSIREGCRLFATLIVQMEERGCDLDTVIQSYNYGGGYMRYVLRNGGKHSFSLAEGFARERSGGVKVTYSNPIAVERNGGWRYKYGNMFYVELVKKCFVPVSGGVGAGIAGTIDPDERLSWLFPSGVPTSAPQMQQYLVQITVPIRDVSGNESSMTLTVHKNLAGDIEAIFQEMARAGFPVRSSDTAGYVWRQMASSANRSHHSYGCVIDLNWTSNPMIGVTGGSYLPGEDPYSVTPEVVAIWKAHGFYWGGDWSGSKDYMHFTYTNH